MAQRRVRIPARFNGPPDSANGGYACGTAAGLLGTAAAKVNLRLPPPLEADLDVHVRDAGVELREGDRLVLDARPSRCGQRVPAPVPVGEAEQAMDAFPWYSGHPFPTCFVCGPERAAGDGLRIFTGAVAERPDVFASAWTPAGDLAGPGGDVRPEIVWAALDCPSAVAAAARASDPSVPAVLACLTASLEAPVRAGEPHAVVAWPLGVDGRKRHAASALLDAGGRVLARAEALWIELRG